MQHHWLLNDIYTVDHLLLMSGFRRRWEVMKFLALLRMINLDMGLLVARTKNWQELGKIRETDGRNLNSNEITLFVDGWGARRCC